LSKFFTSRLADLPLAAISGLTAECVSGLYPSAFDQISAEVVAAIPPEALAAATIRQLERIPRESFRGLSVEHVLHMPKRPQTMQSRGAAIVSCQNRDLLDQKNRTFVERHPCAILNGIKFVGRLMEAVRTFCAENSRVSGALLQGRGKVPILLRERV
jgi:hypothetical protein